MATHQTTQDDTLQQPLLAGNTPDLVPRVIADARRRMAARNVLVFVFGRLWLPMLGPLALLAAMVHGSRHR